MLFLLIRKELLEQLLSLRFALACFLCLSISVTSVYVRSKEYAQATAMFRCNLAKHQLLIEANDLGEVTQLGVNIDKPANLLQICFQGLQSAWTTTVRIHHGVFPQYHGDYGENPLQFLFPEVDLFFFVGVVMSLIAMAFSYDAVAGEKELGTLKLLMSYSLPRDRVLLAKWMGGYLALITPFLLAMLVGLLVLVLSPAVAPSPEQMIALMLIGLAALLYLAAMYSLGIFVSARTRQSSTAITVLLMIWAVMILVVPNVAPFLAARLHPVRSFSAISKEKFQVLLDEWRRSAKELHSREREVGEAAYTAKLQQLAEARTASEKLKQKMLFSQQDGERRIDEQFHNEMDVQIALGRNLSRISPLSSFAYVGTDLAGTGLADRHRFGRLIPGYRRSLTQFVYDRRIDAAERQHDLHWYNMDGYPEFQFEESRLIDRIAWVDILLLSVWSLLFYMGAFSSFLRYDVT